MNLRTKLKRANLLPIDADAARYIKEAYGVDECHWDYYKVIDSSNGSYRVFTERYILNNSLEEITKYD